MEPESAPRPAESLPRPPEQGAPAPEIAPAPTPERAAPPTERPGSGAPIAPTTALPSAPVPTLPKADPGLDQHPPKPPASGPAIADDVDVIEKEWVQKAKTIVSEHKHDPYTQEKETSRLQADYLKKRYGKEVKISE